MVLWPSRDLLQLNIELPVKNSRRLSYDINNLASINVLNKIGMKVSKEFKVKENIKYFEIEGKYR
jgi:hypothetical protein